MMRAKRLWPFLRPLLMIAVFAIALRVLQGTLQQYRYREVMVAKRCEACGRPVPLTSRVGQRCPYCGARHIIKKGVRKNKYGAVQLFYCARCAKKFSPLSRKGKSFPLKVILAAINEYHRFRTLPDVSALTGVLQKPAG